MEEGAVKYANEVINLMGAHPGRRFKVRHIVGYVAPNSTPKQRASIRVGIQRVLYALETNGQIDSSRAQTVNGGDAEYWWKTATSTACRPQQKPQQYRQHNCVRRI